MYLPAFFIFWVMLASLPFQSAARRARQHGLWWATTVAMLGGPLAVWGVLGASYSSGIVSGPEFAIGLILGGALLFAAGLLWHGSLWSAAALRVIGWSMMLVPLALSSSFVFAIVPLLLAFLVHPRLGRSLHHVQTPAGS